VILFLTFNVSKATLKLSKTGPQPDPQGEKESGLMGFDKDSAS
jgi:hypothetical protein